MIWELLHISFQERHDYAKVLVEPDVTVTVEKSKRNKNLRRI